MFKAESAAWNVVRLQWSLYDLRLTSNASWIQDVFHIGSCNLKRFVFWVQDSADVFHQFQPLLLALPNIQDTLAAFLATSCRTSCCTGCQSGWWPIPTSVGGLVVLRVQALGLCQTTGGKSWKWAAVFPRLFWFLFLHWGAMKSVGFHGTFFDWMMLWCESDSKLSLRVRDRYRDFIQSVFCEITSVYLCQADEASRARWGIF